MAFLSPSTGPRPYRPEQHDCQDFRFFPGNHSGPDSTSDFIAIILIHPQLPFSVMTVACELSDQPTGMVESVEFLIGYFYRPKADYMQKHEETQLH